jgi:UDPglucose 6-dehydrogenase
LQSCRPDPKLSRHPDFKAMRSMMRQAVVFDGRNQYEPKVLVGAGFEYWGIGRQGAESTGRRVPIAFSESAAVGVGA